jgi:hypothetical protein
MSSISLAEQQDLFDWSVVFEVQHDELLFTLPAASLLVNLTWLSKKLVFFSK